MTKPCLLDNQKKRIGKSVVLLLVLLFLFLGLNHRQLYSAWAIRSETRRLANLAANAPSEFQNPAPLEDHFDGRLSSDFWKFTAINGGGRVSNESAWHAAAMAFDHSLVIEHFPDPSFPNESPRRDPPGAEQYNNVALISRAAFRPAPSRDVVLKFTARVDENFYGTAGVIFEPVGTLQKDGFFAKPFDMFGLVVLGKEASLAGSNGPICNLALNWMPVSVEPLQANTQSLQTYEVRLRWISQTEWLGIMRVEDKIQCQMPMPAFGPVEVQVWSDNVLVLDRARRGWEIAPSLELKYQDRGNKKFVMEMIQVFEAGQ
jgi:hypothetical protein